MRYPNIDAERSRKGMTYGELAQELGVCRKTLYLWVSDGRIPQSALEKMSHIFGCSIDYLLSNSASKDVIKHQSKEARA